MNEPFNNDTINNTHGADLIELEEHERWTPEHETKLKTVEVQCRKVANMYHEKINFYIFWGIVLNYTIIVSVTAMSPISLIMKDDNSAYRYVHSFTYLAIAILSGMSTVINFGKKAGEYRMAYYEYIRIAEKINYQLVKEIRFRKKVSDFTFEIRHTLTSLVKVSPPLNIHENVSHDLNNFLVN